MSWEEFNNNWGVVESGYKLSRNLLYNLNKLDGLRKKKITHTKKNFVSRKAHMLSNHDNFIWYATEIRINCSENYYINDNAFLCFLQVGTIHWVELFISPISY